MLSLLEEEFPDVCRIVTAMYPSAEDDVITSPYNSVLAMRELTEHADCVLPVENQVFFFFVFLQKSMQNQNPNSDCFCFPTPFLFQSLVDIVNKISVMSHDAKPGSVLKKDGTVTSGQGGLCPTEKPFDAMNNIVANLLLSITRYETAYNY